MSTKRQWLVTTYCESDKEHKKPSYKIFDTFEGVCRILGAGHWEPYDTGNSAFKGYTKQKTVCDFKWNDEYFYSTDTYIAQEVINFEHWDEH